MMRIIRSLHEMQTYALRRRAQGRRIGFAPTMGCLHEGHLSLMRAARKDCDDVVVSIFVNPMQFGPQEDLASYPRTLAADLAQLMDIPVDVAFVPRAADLYEVVGAADEDEDPPLPHAPTITRFVTGTRAGASLPGLGESDVVPRTSGGAQHW